MNPAVLDPDPDGDVTLTLRSHEGERSVSQGQLLDLQETVRDARCDLEDSNGSQDGSFELRVSSKHLMLASPVLRRFLQSGFREGEELRDTGQARLTLEDDDSTALVIFFNIIHGHFNRVPETVTLDTFTEIAILADKYDCREAFRFLIELWSHDLRETVPGALDNDDLLRWVCINWTFGRSVELGKITQIASLRATDRIESELPMLGALDAIEQKRQDLIGRGVNVLRRFLAKYQSKAVLSGCPEYLCDAVVLGTFLRGLIENDLYPFPEPPFIGISVNELIKKVEQLPLACGCSLGHLDSYPTHSTHCKFHNAWWWVRDRIRNLKIA